MQYVCAISAVDGKASECMAWIRLILKETTVKASAK